MGRYPLFDHFPYTLALASKQHEVVLREGLEILHVHYAIPHATSAWIAREMLREAGSDVKVITTLHGTDITIVGQDRSFHPITKFSIEKSDRITAVSQYLRQQTFQAFGCAGCQVEVIYNFIDPDVYNRSKYPPLLSEQLNGGRRVLMHVSNFRPVKRVRDIVRIYARVQEAVPSVLVMVGDGPDRVEAEAEAQMLGVERTVHFLGKIDVVAPLLAGADLFLLPSQSESFGLSALEALASGTPVVGSKAGGLVEVVKEGVTGALREVGDVDAMASASVEILSDRDRWQTMSRDAAADARVRFSRDDIVRQYEALYEDAVK
jgi:N-acetyl-alpha-D-glucosaminyl L-malate synthase BshA